MNSVCRNGEVHWSLQESGLCKGKKKHIPDRGKGVHTSKVAKEPRLFDRGELLMA